MVYAELSGRIAQAFLHQTKKGSVRSPSVKPLTSASASGFDAMILGSEAAPSVAVRASAGLAFREAGHVHLTLGVQGLAGRGKAQTHTEHQCSSAEHLHRFHRISFALELRAALVKPFPAPHGRTHCIRTRAAIRSATRSCPGSNGYAESFRRIAQVFSSKMELAPGTSIGSGRPGSSQPSRRIIDAP